MEKIRTVITKVKKELENLYNMDLIKILFTNHLALL
jgi:hypothetical protein